MYLRVGATCCALHYHSSLLSVPISKYIAHADTYASAYAHSRLRTGPVLMNVRSIRPVKSAIFRRAPIHLAEPVLADSERAVACLMPILGLVPNYTGTKKIINKSSYENEQAV